MGVAVDWSLLGPPVDVFGAVQRGVAQGQKTRLEGDRRNALAAFAADPANPTAANALLAVDPALGFKAREYQHAEADRMRADQFRAAAGDYLANAATRPALPSALGAVGAPAGPAMPNALVLPGAAPDAAADPFVRMARADPAKAIEMRSGQLKLSKAELDQHQDLNSASLRLLASVHDQPSYEAAKQRAALMYGRFGMSLEELGLPDEYDPQVVKGLMLQTLETDKLLAAERADKRLEWDLADDEADNARADRNTDSMIGARGASTEQGWARVGISRESVNRTDARGRRGRTSARPIVAEVRT